MKAHTKLNIIVISSTLFGPILTVAGMTGLVFLLRYIFQLSSGFGTDEWFISGMIALPFSLLIIIPLWFFCGTVFFCIDVDDHEGPRRIPTKWDEPNPEMEALIAKVEKRMKAKKAAEAKEGMK